MRDHEGSASGYRRRGQSANRRVAGGGGRAHSAPSRSALRVWQGPRGGQVPEGAHGGARQIRSEARGHRAAPVNGRGRSPGPADGAEASHVGGEAREVPTRAEFTDDIINGLCFI